MIRHARQYAHLRPAICARHAGNHTGAPQHVCANTTGVPLARIISHAACIEYATTMW